MYDLILVDNTFLPKFNTISSCLAWESRKHKSHYTNADFIRCMNLYMYECVLFHLLEIQSTVIHILAPAHNPQLKPTYTLCIHNAYLILESVLSFS